MTAGFLQPHRRFYSKPSQVASLSQQVTLEDGCTTGGHAPLADKPFAIDPDEHESNGHLTAHLTARCHGPAAKAGGGTGDWQDDLAAAAVAPRLRACVSTPVCLRRGRGKYSSGKGVFVTAEPYLGSWQTRKDREQGRAEQRVSRAHLSWLKSRSPLQPERAAPLSGPQPLAVPRPRTAVFPRALPCPALTLTSAAQRLPQHLSSAQVAPAPVAP